MQTPRGNGARISHKNIAVPKGWVKLDQLAGLQQRGSAQINGLLVGIVTTILATVWQVVIRPLLDECPALIIADRPYQCRTLAYQGQHLVMMAGVNTNGGDLLFDIPITVGRDFSDRCRKTTNNHRQLPRLLRSKGGLSGSRRYTKPIAARGTPVTIDDRLDDEDDDGGGSDCVGDGGECDDNDNT